LHEVRLGELGTNKLVEDLSSVVALVIRIRFVLAEAGESGPDSVGTRNGSSAAGVYPTPSSSVLKDCLISATLSTYKRGCVEDQPQQD
jgi:hypothetical protein